MYSPIQSTILTVFRDSLGSLKSFCLMLPCHEITNLRYTPLITICKLYPTESFSSSGKILRNPLWCRDRLQFQHTGFFFLFFLITEKNPSLNLFTFWSAVLQIIINVCQLHKRLGLTILCSHVLLHVLIMFTFIPAQFVYALSLSTLQIVPLFLSCLDCLNLISI